MKFKTFITYLTAVCVAVFMNAAMAKKSDKSEKSHKSDRHSEKSEKSEKSAKSGKRGNAYGHCQSNRGGHGRGRGRGRDRSGYGCNEPASASAILLEEPVVVLSVCETDAFPEGQIFDLTFTDSKFQVDKATEVDDVGFAVTVITGVSYEGSYCSAEDPLPPFEILVEDEKGQTFCAEENPPVVDEDNSTVSAYYLCAMEEA